MQSPFDLASGGATLTRASLDSVLYANPGLAPLGPGFFRWLFARTALHLGAQPQSLVSKLARKRSLDTNDVTSASKANVHIGADFTAGAITTNVSGAGFTTLRTDIDGKGLDETGIPKIETFGAAYTGVVFGVGKAIGDVAAVGATFKGLYGAESGLSLSRDDLADKNAARAKALQSVKRGSGFGQDIGVVLQKRTKGFDLRLAGTVDDVTGTRITNLPTWKRTINAGAGFTLHTKASAFHCGYDLRDLSRAYGEPTKHRTYMGCKLLLGNYVALGGGLGQGLPAYGVLFNVLFTRLELGMYGRQLGTTFGTKPRKIYYLSLGFHIP